MVLWFGVHRAKDVIEGNMVSVLLGIEEGSVGGVVKGPGLLQYCNTPTLNSLPLPPPTRGRLGLLTATCCGTIMTSQLTTSRP